ncbi:FAD-dependent oxidoreductase [Rhizobium ruizarguesonis]|uniref:FAD-dependent oxidoreductase n=1 Tax=Rhizobium ruizarguesonis TaxID=2081791 RepID=UPI0010323425|nr:FAD-dependent oxidoreductase [Rhizobium ruizarguesonis]TAY61559.1 FAD-dependent oxidoreductase [Rhizobium ruizarguesonis]
MHNPNPSDIESSYKVPDQPLYLVGTFDNGVTVLSQQIRALNLVYALVEGGVIPSTHAGDTPPKQFQKKIAIVGGGFTGLSVAAGLASKGVEAEIVLFEQRDTLLPLQQGSDTRWLHPHIYNWPAEGSEISAANLPLLNWTAARASDVVVQVLGQWRALVGAHASSQVKLFCNTRHLQIHESKYPKKLTIEWIGEERDVKSGNAAGTAAGSTGQTCDFDAVILAIGFGIEADSRLSYWRNDIVGQPNLEQPRLTFLLSGQGDGAMIDLLRLRISHFRQDRILSELFRDSGSLIERLREIKTEHEQGVSKETFQKFETLWQEEQAEFDKVKAKLGSRLRRDTDVILRLKVKKLSDLFDGDVRISFQNRVLVYVLYKCGGFVPSTEKETVLARQHAIPPERIIQRHGTKREMLLKGILSEPLFAVLESRDRDKFRQIDEQQWSGGYFGYTGVEEHAFKADDGTKDAWRKEYLPGATALVASTFCSAVAGFLAADHPADSRLRVTLHRAVSFGTEEVLQQCCRYFGVNLPTGGDSPAGRTFPADNATIGLAYKTHQMIRSRQGVDPGALATAMRFLNLHQASRTMSPEVRFVAALPILTSDKKGGRNPVTGVLYIDSQAENFFLDGEKLQVVLGMIERFAENLYGDALADIDRISNSELARGRSRWHLAQPIPTEVDHALEIVDGIRLPRREGADQFNLEYSDFIPIRQIL